MLLSLLPAAYLAGSIPFGLIVGKSRGIDPRTSGSGNIGATNVGRLLGMKYFFLVFALDLLKGLLPVAVASIILWRSGPAADRSASDNLLHLLVGVAAIFGHMFSAFLGFKGGKGVATSAGVALGIYPFFTLAGLIALAIWGAVYGISKYVSVASIVAAICLPLVFIGVGLAMGWDVFGKQLPMLVFACLITAMIVWRHRSNIARLRAGTEGQFKGKAP